MTLHPLAIGISLVAHLFGGSVSGATNIASQWGKGRFSNWNGETDWLDV